MLGTPVGGVELISGVVLSKVWAGPRLEGASSRECVCEEDRQEGQLEKSDGHTARALRWSKCQQCTTALYWGQLFWVVTLEL